MNNRRVQRMKSIRFEEGAIEIDAAIVAEGLGIVQGQLMERLRDRTVTSLCERGIDEDSGRYRLTFFSENRRLRLVVDQSGTIIQRSAIDFGVRPLPASAHKPGK
jgi:Family of unknown function (DUF6522)